MISIYHHPKNSTCCKSAIYKSFHVISDTLLSLKCTKNGIFGPKNASKNSVFASFFIKNALKTRYFHQKNDLKTQVFGIKWSKVNRAWYIIFGLSYANAKLRPVLK